MATTLLSGPSDPLLVSPTADVVEPPSVSDPTLAGIVNEDAPYEVRVKAARMFEDDAVSGIADAPIDSKHKDAAIKFLDKDIAIANAQLFKDWQSSKVMEEFPTIAERDDFVAAAVKGGNNPDAYSNPRHSQFIADLNETSGNLFGGLNRSWTGEAKTPSGYKVAGYTVKPMSNGEAVVNLKMQGQEPTEALAVPSPSPVTVRHPELDKGWDSFSRSIKIKLPNDSDVESELGKTDQRIAEINRRIPEIRNAMKQEQEQMKSPLFGEQGMSQVGEGLLLTQLEAERKQLSQRRDSLTKDGKRVLANERVADSIRTTPELVSQIRDKGVGERLANATESLIMSLNVAGEEVGLPWQQGARAGAAEAQSIKGELGLGMEQAEFRGTLADKIGIATVENIPLLALQAGASGAGIAASMGPMAVASYGQNLVAAEQQAQSLEDAGDMDGARKVRDNARAYAGLMAVADIGTEMMFGPEGAPLSKAARGMTALNRFVKAPTKEGIEEIGAGVIQSQFAPLIGKYEEAFNSDRIVEFGAGFFGSQMQQVPGAMLNRQQTPQQQIEAAKEQLQTIAANMGVNVYDKTPDEIDITAKAVPTVDDAGKPSSIPNLFGMEQKEGSQNWSIQDPWLRQRAFQAGVKSEFPTEEEAQQFAATMHEQVAKAELTQAAQAAGIPQEQIDSGITLITSALRQAAIAEEQPDAALWARYQFTFAPQVPVSEESIPDTRNEPSNIPPTGAQLDTPAQQSAQAIENTLTGEERVRQSAVGGKLLADRLRTQETATAEAPEMTAAWEKRRAHALAMQDQEPAYVADAQGHPAVTTTLTALDAYDAAQDDDAKLEVLNDIQPATVAAAERIAENTIAKIEADESLNDEEKKAMTEKWWKFAEDIKSVRVAAPESSFTKIEAPAPSAPSRESEAGAVATSPPGASPPVVAASTKEAQKPEKATTRETLDELIRQAQAANAGATQEAQRESGSNQGDVQASKGEARTTATDEGGAGGELQRKSEKPVSVIKQGDKVKFRQEGVLLIGTYQGVNADGTYSVLVKGEKVPRHVSARSLNENNGGAVVEGTRFSLVEKSNPLDAVRDQFGPRMSGHVNNNSFEEKVLGDSQALQRGYPEEFATIGARDTALGRMANGGTGVRSHLWEHLGDLFHRAGSTTDYRNMRSKVENFLNQYNRYGIQSSLKDQTRNNAIYQIAKRKYGNYTREQFDQVAKSDEGVKAVEEVERKLRFVDAAFASMYERMQAFTPLQAMGRNMAIAFGLRRYAVAKQLGEAILAQIEPNNDAVVTAGFNVAGVNNLSKSDNQTKKQWDNLQKIAESIEKDPLNSITVFNTLSERISDEELLAPIKQKASANVPANTENATPATPTIETRLQEGRAAENKKQAAANSEVMNQLPPEEAAEQASMLRDMMASNKSLGKPIPQGWVDRLAVLEGKPKPQEGEIYSNVIEGHPEHESSNSELQYLIPIKITKPSDLDAKFDRAQGLLDKWNKEIGTAEFSAKQAKTAAQKKKAQAKLSSLGSIKAAREVLRDEIIPELNRLLKEAKSKTPSTTPKATTTTPTPSGTKLKAKIEGSVQDVEYIRDNNDGTHQVKAGGVETSVRSGNLSENNGGALFQSRSSGAVTPQQDAEYMAAVESGDVDEQQRLVDEAAKKAGYNVGPVWHGTGDNPFTEFDTVGEKGKSNHFGAHFATDKTTADFFSSARKGKTGQYYIKTKEPLRLSDVGSWAPRDVANDLKARGEIGDVEEFLDDWLALRTAYPGDPSTASKKALREALKNLGYDSIVYLNRYETVRPGESSVRGEDYALQNQIHTDTKGQQPSTVDVIFRKNFPWATDSYIALDPSQIKSADPITRDDAGNVIPLSQRFNPESNSILYQSGQETGGTIKGKIETPEGTLRHAVVTLTSNSDVSTIMHEFIHGLALLETRTGENTTRSLLQSVLGNKAPAFYAWASEGTEGMSADDAHVRMHERIAEGFEKWLTDGSLPAHKNQGVLRKAFESIRAAMRNIVRDMLGAGYDYKFINSSTPLPANVQASYQQLFALLDRDAVGVRDTTSLSMLQHIGANNAEALDALFPLTRAVGTRRESLTPAELADISARTGDSVEELTKQAQQSVKNSTLFQSLGEGLPADKAKYLIDAGTAAMVNAMAKNAGVMPTFDEWLGGIRQTANPAFNGVSDAALQTIHYASQLNIPATKALSVQQQVDDAIIAAGETVTPESKAAFMDAINTVMPSLAPDMAKRLKVAATAAASAETGVERDRAMNAAMKIVRADARAKFSITAQQLTTLLRGYKLGSNNANQVRDIIAETKKTILPLMKAGEVGNATKKMVNDALSLMENTANGSVDMSDVVDLMLLNINEVKNDLARHAESNFLRGVREGGKYAASQFKARQQAIIGVVLDNLKTVTGLSQQQTERVIKQIGNATTDKQLNKAVWKAMLLFQDQRVRDAYDHVSQLQEAIKANIKKGKFGDMTDWVALFNSFETHTIPQHMLAQYLSLAEPLAAKDPVILLNGLKNQLESMNRQMTEWLEANPEDEQTRPPTLSNGLAEALERLAILDELDSAKRSRSQERFVTKQQEFGKSKPMAEEAARAISQMRVFETFEEADEDELVSTFTNRQLRGIVNSFINYNDGIVTPFLVQLAQGLKATRFQKQFLPNLTYGVRHFLRLSGDARLDADDAELRSNGMIGRVIGVIAGYRGMDDSAKNIEKQFRKAGIHNFDSMLNTASWINENVTQPMSKAQVVGLLERDRILTMKDEHGMSIKDYELALDDPSHYNESLLRAMRPEMASPVFSNPLARAVGEKVSNIKNARRELMSRIMGMAMHQRQREKNGMEGNYIEYILDGAFKRKGTAFVENEFKRQQAAARVIKTMLGTQKATAANISAFLPQAAKQAMAHTRSIFDRTGQWTYFLNMIENEELLPMPEAYFPIMSMEENTTIEQRVKNLTGIPLGAIGSITPRVAPRAASRHARLNENLKMANADFFAVVNDAVHQAAADSAMTPFLKTMDRGMNGIQRLTNEDGNGLFGGTANNVVVELHKAMIEHGARMSHVILADPGVATRASSYIASIFPKMVLDKVQRPIVEGVGNLTTILTYGNQKQFASGLSAVWGGKGNNEAWGKLMLSLRAPTALRNGSESTTGPMQDLAASIDSAFAADPHAPTWTENLIAEIQNKKPQRQGLLQRSQSHVLARMTSAMRKLLVTAGEQMWIRPYWAGIFSDSIKQQTGTDFSFDAQKAGAYPEQVLNNAVSAAETEIARIMSPSARGAGRLVSQQSLDSDETTGLIKNMIYAMTNFIGAQSNTAKFAMKALVEGRAGNIDRRKAASNIIGLFMGNLVVNTASSFFVLAMRALIDSLRLEDDEEKNSVALQQFSEWLSSANPMNVKSSAVFWSKMGFRSAFSLRFGGLNTLMRFLVGTGTELAAWGIGTAAGGFKSGYDPFKDNLTFEAEPSITAISGYLLGISDDPALKRAFQNSNVFTATRMMGSVNAVVNLATALGNDVSSIARYTRGEGDALGAAANFAVNIGMLLSSVPFYATLADSTGQMAKLESPWYRQYEQNAMLRMARRAGKEYATTGEMRYKEQIDGMPKQYQKTARDEITKIKYLERASTVHGNPEATDRLKASFEAIRNEPEVSRHIKLAAEFRRMEEAGLKQKFLSGLRLLKTTESKFGSTFGSKGASAEFAQKLRAYEKEATGKTPAWNALYGN